MAENKPRITKTEGAHEDRAKKRDKLEVSVPDVTREEVRKTLVETLVVPESPKSGDAAVMNEIEITGSQILTALRAKNKRAYDLAQQADKTIANAAEHGQNITSLTKDPARVQNVQANFNAVLDELRSLVKGVKQELKEADQLAANLNEHKGPRPRT